MPASPNVGKCLAGNISIWLNHHCLSSSGVNIVLLQRSDFKSISTLFSITLQSAAVQSVGGKSVTSEIATGIRQVQTIAGL